MSLEQHRLIGEEIEGVIVNYVQVGQGSDLVMLSGLLGSSRAFDFVLDDFAHDFRATTVDLPGYGVSGEYPKDRRYSPQEHARSVIGLMDKLGIEKTDFVGDSYGCDVGLVLAVEYTGRIRRLVLQGPPKLDLLKPITKFREDVAIAIAKKIQSAKALTYWQRRLNPEFRYLNEEQLSNADDRMGAASVRAAIESSFDIINFDFTYFASRLTVPTLIIEGADMNVIPISSSRVIINSAPRGIVQVKRIKGSHTLLSQKPQEFVGEVTRFLKED